MPYYLNQEGIGSDLAPLQSFAPTAKESFAAQVGEAWAGNPTTLGVDALGVATANRNGQRLTASDAANVAKEAGVGEFAPGEAEYTREALDLVLERKRQERKRQDVIAGTPWSWTGTPLRGAAMLGATLLDPLNVGSAFVPVVGEARYAALLAKAGSAGARALVRTGVGAAEGFVGTALLEPFVYGGHAYLDDDYSMYDSAASLAFGTFMGGGLHVVGGSVADALKPGRWDKVTTLDDAAAQPDIPAPRTDTGSPAPGSAAATALDAGPEARAATTRVGMGQFAEGKLTQVEPLMATGDAAPRAAAATPPAAPGTRRYYHGGAPEQVDGALWFTSDLNDARGWAARGDGMGLWYVDVPETHPLAAGDMANGMPPSTRVEFPADIAKQRQKFSDGTTPDGMTTLYRGESGGNDKGGQWWTTDPAKAARYGDVQSVQLSAHDIQMHSAQGHGGTDEFVFPNKRPHELATEAATKADAARAAASPEATRAAAARVASPEGSTTVDFAEADAATERLKQAPKRTDVVAATKMADEAKERALRARGVLEASGASKERLTAFDEAMAEADGFVAHGDELGRAVEFAAECGIGRA